MPVVAAQCRLQLFDGRQVEVVGRFVQHEEVDAGGGERRQLGPGALTGRERRRRSEHRFGTEPELGQLRPGCRGDSPVGGHERFGQAGGRPEARAGPGPARPRRRSGRCAASRGQGEPPRSASTSVVLPDPLGPTSAMRSAQPMSSVNGPSVKSPRSTTASSSRTTTSPDRAASLMLNCRSQPSQGFSTSVERLERALGAPRPRRQPLSPVDAEVPLRLVVVPRTASSRGLTPVVAHWRSRWARRRSSARWDS